MKLTVGMQSILDVLEQDGPSIPAHIAERTGLSFHTLYSGKTKYLQQLNKAGLIHISAWKRRVGSSGPAAPLWDIGNGKNAPKPKKTGNREACQRYRLKQRLFTEQRSVLSLVLGTRSAACRA